MKKEKNWFAPKIRQVSYKGYNELFCFGIKIEDRYGGFKYIQQMMNFCYECAKDNIDSLISNVFYDKDFCFISTRFIKEIPSPQREQLVDKILACARKTIYQFYIDDGECHIGLYEEGEADAR